MLRREWGAERNGKLLHIFIPSESATVVPDFEFQDLTLGRTAALVLDFAEKDLPWQNSDDGDVYVYPIH